MTNSKQFHLGDILSITTGILLSPSHMEGVYKICNYMTGTNNYTHQLIRAGKECEIALLHQHPQLANITVPRLNEDSLINWLKSQIHTYGEFLPVLPLSAPKHIDPIEEAYKLFGSDKVDIL